MRWLLVLALAAAACARSEALQPRKPVDAGVDAGSWLPDGGRACHSDAECGPNQVCFYDLQICDQGSFPGDWLDGVIQGGTCVTAPGAPCSSAGDCFSGLVCDAGACTVPAQDCPEGFGDCPARCRPWTRPGDACTSICLCDSCNDFLDAGCVEVTAYDAGHDCDVANPCGPHQGCDPVLLLCNCRSGHNLEIGTRCVDVSDVVGPTSCQSDGDCGFHWTCNAGTCVESACDESGCEPGCYSTSMTHVTCSPCICGSCAFEGD